MEYEFVQLISAMAIPQNAWKGEIQLRGCGLVVAGSPPGVSEADDGTYYIELRFDNGTRDHWVIAPKHITPKAPADKSVNEIKAKVAARSIVTYLVAQRALTPPVSIAFVRSSTPRGPERMGWDAGRSRVVVCGPLVAPPTPRLPSSPPLAPQTHLPTTTFSSSSGGVAPSGIVATFSSSAGRNSIASSTPPFHQGSSLRNSSLAASTPGTSPQLYPVVTEGSGSTALPPLDDFALPTASSVGPPLPTAKLVPIVTGYSTPLSSPTTARIHVPFGACTSVDDLGASPLHPSLRADIDLVDFLDLGKETRRDGLRELPNIVLIDVVADLPPP